MKTTHVICGLATVLLISCGADSNGGHFAIPFTAGGIERDESQPLTFTNAAGWTVTLRTARIALGPLYFKESEAAESDPNDLSVIIRTNAQVTNQFVVDALDPVPKSIEGGVDGRQGTSVAAEIGLLSPDTRVPIGDRDLLRKSFAYVAGSASRNGTTIDFEGRMLIDQSMATTQEPLMQLTKVKSAVVNLPFDDDAQQLALRVNPAPWFERVDFSTLTETVPGSTTLTWSTESTVHALLLDGVKGSTGVYFFALKRGSSPQ